MTVTGYSELRKITLLQAKCQSVLYVCEHVPMQKCGNKSRHNVEPLVFWDFAGILGEKGLNDEDVLFIFL